MEQIEKQVAIASRFLLIRRLIHYLTWTLSAGLGVALIGLALPKFWAVAGLATESAASRWNLWWLVSAIVGSLAVAIALSWIRRDNPLDAAVEIDRRFQLKERLSTALSLDRETRDSGIGAALVKDAERAAGRIDVRDQFTLGWSPRNLIPLVPAVLACLLIVFVDNAESTSPEETSELSASQRERIQAAHDAIKEKLNEELRKAEEDGLEEAEAALREIDRVLDEPDLRDPVSRERALVKLNEVKEALEQRARELGNPEAMRRQLAAMDQPTDGPAEKVAEALKDGDLDQAAEELQNLADQLANNELDEQQQQQLAEQLNQMKEELQDKVEQHQETQQLLREQVQQAIDEGDVQKAGELQQALDQSESMNDQMEQASDLAQSLSDASSALGESSEGQPASSAQLAEAQQALAEAASQMSELQSDLNEIDALQSIIDQISESKQSINQSEGNPSQDGSPTDQGSQSSDSQSDGSQSQDSQSQGSQSQGSPSGGSPSGGSQTGDDPSSQSGGQSDQQGSGASQQGSQSQGNGQGSDSGEPGRGNGEGQGRGARGEQENETGAIDERVNATPTSGEAVVTGTTGGENLAGGSRAEIIRRIREPVSTRNDPLQGQTLPRRQQDHAREYFREFSRQNQNN